MFLLVCLLASIAQLTSSSSIVVDYTANTVPNAQAYIIDYSPPVGFPPAGSSLDSNVHRTAINGTISAAEYTVYVSAIMGDGSRRNVTQLVVNSSPDPPTLDSVETTDHEATISYFPPQGSEISYHLEYYPEGHQEYSNVVETKASLVRLRGLDAGTAFRLRIKSIYRGVYSQTHIDAGFNTQGTPTYEYSSSETFSVRTLPPNLDLATTTEAAYYEYSKEVGDEDTSTVAAPMASVATTKANAITTQQPASTTATTKAGTTTTPRRTSASTSSHPATTTAGKLRPQEVDSGDYGVDDGIESQALLGLETMTQEYGHPAEIALSDDKGMLRLSWDAPEGSPCEAFFVNYTILTLSRPRSFSLATSQDTAVIKFFAEHTLDVRVFCMLAGSLSKTWWAHRIAHLSKPKIVEGLRVDSVETDEFYVARIKLAWKWPPYHNFENYKLMVSYGLEKGTMKEVEVTSKEEILLDKLEAAHLYKIAVRNVSTELPLESFPAELQQITPPLISSTVYPGQISSTSININFGESDPEQGRFDYYLLTFSGNNKNITKKIELDQEKSFTFTKLIPGKTYHFAVYTVYKGVQSRPVDADVTTYPLKVNQLFPVVGRDYVVLYWDIENFADANCRFRVSYNADNIPTVSVELKGASRHRFTGLEPDVYYTFTITVIMGNGKAAAESESEMTTVVLPKGRLAPLIQRQGTRELVVQFENDQSVFTQLNGAPENFAVIVSDDTTLNDDSYELKSWFEVKEEEDWGSYRASPSDWNPFTEQGTRKAVFTVGTDDCLKRSLDEPYCNGILRANVNYMVKIRMYTDTKVAIESEWGAIEGAVGDDEKEEEEDSHDRRFPCHMYLNGCPRKTSHQSLGVWHVVIGLLMLVFQQFQC